VKPVEAEAWNESVACYDYSKFYHLYQWGALLEEVHGHELFYLKVDKSIFPVACVKSRIFGKRLISLPFADYGGPCAQDENTAERLILECLEKAQVLGVDFIEVRGPNNRYFGCLEKHGFVRRDDYLTFVLQLDKGIQGLWRGIGDKTRNRVRKAQKSGIEIIEAANKSDLRAFYLIYLKTMKRLGSPPQSYKYFERIWDLFYPSRMMMPLARCAGRHIAGGLVFLHGETMHFAYSCSLSEYQQLAPNDSIWWHVIKSGHERGFRYIDFGRSREDEGTVLFKRRWGGELVKMPYFYKFYGEKLDERQEVRYRWASHLWSRFVPESVASRLGPFVIKQIG